MRFYFAVYFALLSCFLISCAGGRAADNTKNAPLHLPENTFAASVDTVSHIKSALATSAADLPRRLFGLLPAAKPGKFKNKGTLIIQTGTGNTAAAATKPAGPMATGAAATAVDAKKADAPVQLGTGNTATDNTKAGSRGGAAATGDGSSATATTEKGGVPWWVYALVAALGVAGGWVLRGKASVWNWWPEWARPG